jgi:hypothetical protein
MNNSLIALAMLCLSPTTNVGNITIANRVPAVCSTVLGSPPLPVSVSEMTYTDDGKALEAVLVKKATTLPKRAKKPAKRARCKPGRWRNSRGICGRWR